MKAFLIYAVIFLTSPWLVMGLFAQSGVTFTGTELLGRPTDRSITVNAVADTALDVYFEYGTSSGSYTNQTAQILSVANVPIEVVIDGLAPNTRYYYRMVYRETGETEWIYRDEHSFHTQRPAGNAFTFTIISDSHLGQYGGQQADELALYEQTLLNAVADQPDFHIDLGDTFAMDPQPLGTGMTEAEADEAYLIQRPYMGIISDSAPVFLAIGNHENEEGWNFDDTFDPPDQSLAVVGLKARKKYFPNPIPDSFYFGNQNPLPDSIGGDTNREDYFAWEWGNALFIILDPFHYSMTWPSEGNTYGGEGQDGEPAGDRWDWTLGIEQYLWFKDVLENSDAEYKFVLSHHVTGGATPYGRGGISAAPYFEWGGLNSDGTWGFDTERPAAEGWDVPIHQLMVDNGVDIFFHGHDHIYAMEMLDGIVYLETPKPDDAGYAWEPYGYGVTEGLYPDAFVLPNSGHIRVSVSPSDVTVDYVRSYLPGDGPNGEIGHTFSLSTLNPPEQPQLVQPVNEATDLPADVTLEVTVTDPDNDDLTVTFYGGAIGGSTEIIATINDIPSGGTASVTWAGLAHTTEHEWYVEIFDGILITRGPVWSFTTEFIPSVFYDLTVAVSSSGGSTSYPAGVYSFEESSIVTITAIPAARYEFGYWEGDADYPNSPTTTVTMDGDKTITAYFIRKRYEARAQPGRRRQPSRDNPLEQ